jgi:hypothetical protein
LSFCPLCCLAAKILNFLAAFIEFALQVRDSPAQGGNARTMTLVGRAFFFNDFLIILLVVIDNFEEPRHSCLCVHFVLFSILPASFLRWNGTLVLARTHPNTLNQHVVGAPHAVGAEAPVHLHLQNNAVTVIPSEQKTRTVSRQNEDQLTTSSWAIQCHAENQQKRLKAV